MMGNLFFLFDNSSLVSIRRIVVTIDYMLKKLSNTAAFIKIASDLNKI